MIHRAEDNFFQGYIDETQLNTFREGVSWDIAVDVSINSDYIFQYVNIEDGNEEEE